MEKQKILKGIFSDGNMTFIQGLAGIFLIEEDWMKRNKASCDKKKIKETDLINHFKKTKINSNQYEINKLNT